jgi:heptosyltransferase-2
MMMIEKMAARRILVRAPNWLGDAIMCVPAIRGLAEVFEPEEMVVLARSSLNGLYERYAFISRVQYLTIEGSHRAHKALSNSGFDAFFLFTNSFGSALDALLTKCPVRVGYGGNFRGVLLTHIVPKWSRVHMADYYLNLVRPFGANMFSQNPDFPILKEEADFADEIKGLNGSVGLPLGAQYGRAKCWPHKHLKSFIKLLVSHGRRAVLFGTKNDHLQAEALEAVAPGAVVNLAGKTTIGQMAAVMTKCDWVVANDSGPLHVAAAVGVNTVAIFGPTDRAKTAPTAECVRVLTRNVDCSPCFRRECNRDHRCMQDISAEDVWAVIAEGAEVKSVASDYEKN